MDFGSNEMTHKLSKIDYEDKSPSLMFDGLFLMEKY